MQNRKNYLKTICNNDIQFISVWELVPGVTGFIITLVLVVMVRLIF